MLSNLFQRDYNKDKSQASLWDCEYGKMRSPELRERLKRELSEDGYYVIEESLMEYVLGIIEGLEDDKDLYYRMLSETQRWQLNS